MRVLFYLLIGAALAFLGMVAGSAATYFERFPGTYFISGFKAAETLYRFNIETQQEIEAAEEVAVDRPVGLLAYKEGEARDGYTLYTSGHDAYAYLLDMNGEVVHEWSAPFDEVWPSPDHLEAASDDVHFRKALVTPSGELYAIYEGMRVTPYGHGMVKLDKDSNVIWTYADATHHDFNIGADGRIYALTHENRTEPYPDLPGIAPPVLEDFIVILDANGIEQNRISLLEVFVDTPYEVVMNGSQTTLTWGKGNYTHTNTIDYVDAATAEAHPYAREGQLLVSMRDIGMIALIDPATRKIVWAERGPWLTQHDPDMLPNGNILLFDNMGDTTPTGRSRVLEFDPMTKEMVWIYNGSQDKPLESLIRASQQRLDNGNTLITESESGRLLEVSSAGAIVWEYMNPHTRMLGEKEIVAFVCWGQRLDADAVAFLQ